MYSSIEIAEYIIWYCDVKKNYYATYHLLQIFLYLIQAYFLIEKESPCFEDSILATKEGPKILKVEKRYSKYKGIIKFNNYNHSIANNDVLLINDIIDNFMRESVSLLTNEMIDHKPFANALKRDDKEISLEELKSFFDDYDNKYLRFNLLTYSERDYLSSYIKPFKSSIVGIIKFKVEDEKAECLEISYTPLYEEGKKYPRISFIFLPEYDLYTTYKNLEFGREYTLEELKL